MSIDDNFITNLPNNTILAEKEIVRKFFEIFQKSNTSADKTEYHIDFIEIFSLYQIYAETNNLSIAFPKLSNNKKDNISIISSFFRDQNRNIERKIDFIEQESILNNKRTHFKELLSKDLLYDFTENDKDKIRKYIEDIINIINVSDYLDEGFKKRLLKRIVLLKTELDRNNSTLEKFWVLIGDAGIIVGRFGENSKELVLKIRSIINMVWRIQARSEQLTADIPLVMLGYDDSKEDN